MTSQHQTNEEKQNIFYLCFLGVLGLLSGNALLCRWFRFAQLAKGKKFRP